ncbi:MAG: hypothetical protein ACYTEZ_02485 [Planctomycetota bacterium]|jgi:uncharacterized membrane protein
MTFDLVPPIGGWALGAAAVAAVVVLAAMWRGTRGAGPTPRRLGLVALRGVVVVALLLALCGPSVTSTPGTGRDLSLAILLDTSRSMSVADGANGTSRLKQAAALAARIREECEDDDHDVTIFRCDDVLRPLGPGETPRARGEATRLRHHLERLLAGDGAAAVVVVSDGLETGARTGPPLTAPVHAVALGTDLRAVPNLGFGAVEFPETLDVGTRGRARAEVVASGPPAYLAAAREVPLVLRADGVERTVATLDLSRGGCVPVEFDLEPDAEGFRRYELVLPEVGREATALDNRREALVDVRRPDFRVLYFSARLDQEFRTIRREAAEITGLDFTSVIELSPGRFSIQGERPGDGLARGLPDDTDRLARFHAIVLGAFPAAALPAPAHRALRAYVEQGGGLVWLAADDGFGRGGWSASPLRGCAPLAFGASDPAPVRQPVAVAVAPEAARHPLARGLLAALDSVPLAVEGLYRFGAPLPGSEIVLRARGPAGAALPALITREVGQGRVVVLAASTWFRWRSAGGAAARAYAVLWRQTLRHAASRDDARARLAVATDRERYDPGAVAVVSATVRDADLAPVASAAVRGTLLALDGQTLETVAFEPSAGEPGRYTARIQLGGAGTLRAAVAATGEKGVVGRREVLLRVGGAREGERVARDRDYLRLLAESTGGRLYEPGEIEALIERLTTRSRADRAAASRSLVFDGPWAFLVVFLLAAGDWIIRRRWKLI